MRLRFLTAACLSVALALSACAGITAPGIPASQPADTASPATATAVPPTATSVPPSPTPVPITAPSKSPSSKPASSAIGAGDLAPIVLAMAAAKSYRITLTSTSSIQGASGTFVVEVVKPDRIHTKADAGGGQLFESISIGTDTYLKIGDRWLKSPVPVPLSPVILSGDPVKLLAQISSTQNTGTITKGASTKVDGTACQEWLWTPPASTANALGGTMCIGLKDNLPVQFKTTDGSFVAKYSDWNAPIAIDAPAV